MNTETTQLARLTPLPKASRGPKARREGVRWGCKSTRSTLMLPRPTRDPSSGDPDRGTHRDMMR